MRTILAAVDGSPREPDVVRAAIAMARDDGATIVLLRCVAVPAEVPVEALTVAPADVPALLEARAMKALEVLKGQILPEIPTKLRAVVATPWEGIERVAGEENVDLIIVGSHGYTGVDRLLGTTAAKVVNHADRSVLVVRDVGRLVSV
jgi:nucleotide-binding universal stress UspA family protein